MFSNRIETAGAIKRNICVYYSTDVCFLIQTLHFTAKCRSSRERNDFALQIDLTRIKRQIDLLRNVPEIHQIDDHCQYACPAAKTVAEGKGFITAAVRSMS